MAHTTLLTRTGCETKIYFNLRGTGVNTLAHNYFGSYAFYGVSTSVKNTIQRLIYSSNHINGVDVYGDNSLREYRYNGTPTASQKDANNALMHLLCEIETTQETFTEAEIRERQGTTTTTAATTTAETPTATTTSAATTAVNEHWMERTEILNRIRDVDNHYYHEGPSGSNLNIVAAGLAKIPEVNGVKTSIACEWEMGSMTASMQEQWAEFLYSNNVVVSFEHDGTVRGGEYPTEPMEPERFVAIMKLWQQHIAATNNNMSSTGAHITIGKSDDQATERDLRIRLARYGQMLQSITTSEDRKLLFGRDYGQYCYQISAISSSAVTHGAIFSCDGRIHCFEFRLPNYKMDVRATTNILLEIASVVFYHAPTIADIHRFIDLVAGEVARLRHEEGDLI